MKYLTHILALLVYVNAQSDDTNSESESSKAAEFGETLGFTFLDWLLKHGQKFIAKETLKQQMKFLETTDPEYAKSLKRLSADNLAATAVANQARLAADIPSTGNKLLDLFERNGFPLSQALEGFKELKAINEPEKDEVDPTVTREILSGIFQKIIATFNNRRNARVSNLPPSTVGSAIDSAIPPSGSRQQFVDSRGIERVPQAFPVLQGYQQRSLQNPIQQGLSHHYNSPRRALKFHPRQHGISLRKMRVQSDRSLPNLSLAELKNILIQSEKNRKIQQETQNLHDQANTRLNRRIMASQRLRALSAVNPINKPASIHELRKLRVLEDAQNRLGRFQVLPVIAENKFDTTGSTQPFLPVQQNFIPLRRLALNQLSNRQFYPTSPKLSNQHFAGSGKVTRYRLRNRVNTVRQGPGGHIALPSGIPHLSSVNGKLGTQRGKVTEYDGEIRLPKNWLSSPKIGARILTKTRNTEGGIGGLGIPLIGQIG